MTLLLPFRYVINWQILIFDQRKLNWIEGTFPLTEKIIPYILSWTKILFGL
jgi:hypothetical protein